MRKSLIPRLSLSIFKQEQVLFWLNGQSILVIAEKKRKQHDLVVDTGFIEGKVADFDKALATIAKVSKKNLIVLKNPFRINKAIVFIPTNSSPVEKTVMARLFRRAGFSNVELRNYSTSFQAFLIKQDYEKGVFVYIGQEISEIGVFSAEAQQSFVIYYSLNEARTEVVNFFREKHLFEIFHEVALNIYQELGKQGKKFSLVVRGRSSRNKEILTTSFSFKDVEPLFSFLQKKVFKELDSVIQNNSFRLIQPEKWVILGDDFFQLCLKSYQEKPLRLKSEFDLMQGIEWL